MFKSKEIICHPFSPPLPISVSITVPFAVSVYFAIFVAVSVAIAVNVPFAFAIAIAISISVTVAMPVDFADQSLLLLPSPLRPHTDLVFLPSLYVAPTC
jgi:hypothetical protein